MTTQALRDDIGERGSAPSADALTPAWYRELTGTLGINAQFVLEGNIHDRYLLPDANLELQPVPGLIDAVWSGLSRAGFELLIIYEPGAGIRVHPRRDENVRQLGAKIVGQTLAEDGNGLSLPGLTELMPRIVNHRENSAALVIARAARLAPDPSHLDQEPLEFFTTAERVALGAVAVTRPSSPNLARFNPIIWLTERDRELPAWLLAHSDQIRSIAIPLPDYGQRRRCAEKLLRSLPGYPDATEAARELQVERFTQQTEGMTLNAMFAITKLARGQGGMSGVEDAARAYRVGIVDNPWGTADLKARLADGEERIGRKVLGQRDAVRKSLDIMIRSATGLTGAHRSPYATRPRGVLFFAGPTGVGKTELAKQLTELVFGDESAYVRFDMSEFSNEHTAQRLIGAPPGYVGYDAGGELTNAMRERPFSLILFDEIEKAHGRILDKFLQILEDGRLTDGRGATVFFSEAVLVFTSNLGVWVEGPDGQRVPNVSPGTDRVEAEEKILAAIKHHFNVVLGRPELLNRLGDNIVVFDFVDRETGEEILDLLIRTVAARVHREHRAELVLSDAAREQMSEYALANLEHGGRGIGSVVENALVNPLARAIFEREEIAGQRLEVVAVERRGRTYELELA